MHQSDRKLNIGNTIAKSVRVLRLYDLQKILPHIQSSLSEKIREILYFNSEKWIIAEVNGF